MPVSPTAGPNAAAASSAAERGTVRLATAEEVPRLADALADAFARDPVYTWMLPGGLRLRARLRTMFGAELEQYILPNNGTVWTTAGCDGAAAVLPPGAWEMPSSVSGRQALKWVRAFGTRFPRAVRVQKATEEHHLREPHFYVRVIGVRPALQGQGVGSALMQPALQRADSAGLPVYLEASSRRSAALYERLGFEHLDALELPDNGPPVWRMRRPPAESTHPHTDT